MNPLELQVLSIVCRVAENLPAASSTDTKLLANPIAVASPRLQVPARPGARDIRLQAR
jgi:hypothetical protein